jgi:tRNA dimethylallyltransferase
MTNVKDVFFIVGPTATGKSEIAADVASELGAEIVSADAFQIYRGLDLLSAKPETVTLAKVPHHLIGTMSILDKMSAAKFRERALVTISEIHSRGKLPIVVGGSGLYIKALTHGLSSAPAADPDLRTRLNELSLHDLQTKLQGLDPEVASKIDLKNCRRLVRAIEVCLLSEQKTSGQRKEWESEVGINGVFVFRERNEIYERINRRVEALFDAGVIEEVRNAGTMSETASKMIGLREIRQVLDGPAAAGSILQCVAAIQQATRRYAKRQLTWFRQQTNFHSLNLSLLTHVEAVEWISQRARLARAQGNV